VRPGRVVAPMMRALGLWLGGLWLVLGVPRAALPQVPPTASEMAAYAGLHAAAARDDVAEILEDAARR
jgi:multidrug efflux pump subunit AcrB